VAELGHVRRVPERDPVTAEELQKGALHVVENNLGSRRHRRRFIGHRTSAE